MGGGPQKGNGRVCFRVDTLVCMLGVLGLCFSWSGQCEISACSCSFFCSAKSSCCPLSERSTSLLRREGYLYISRLACYPFLLLAVWDRGNLGRSRRDVDSGLSQPCRPTRWTPLEHHLMIVLIFSVYQVQRRLYLERCLGS